MKMRMLVLFLFLSLMALATFGHNGMEHVMGTVKSISGNSVTVETAAKEPKVVTVALLPSTKFVKSGADASVKDLKVGDRVMIESKANSEDKLEAVTVMFGKPAHNSAKDTND